MHKLKRLKFDKNALLIIVWVVLLALFSISLLSLFLLSENDSKDSNTQKENIVDDESFAEYSNMNQVEKCFSVPNNEQQKCFDDFIEDYAKSEGKDIKDLLLDLEIARTQNVSIENSCHPVAHAIGRYSLEKYSNVGDAFEKCDLTCHSGCYHGVMERLFFSDEELAESTNHLSVNDLEDKIPGICDESQFKNPSNSIIFQCLHGVGHAILYSLNYNLEDALTSCDFFKTSYEESSCYGGVFMENVTAFDKKLRDIDPTQPMYPCTKIDDKYRRDCFMMQTSLMFEYGLTSEQIAAECLNAGDYKTSCFVSLGRDLSNYVRTDATAQVVEACENYSRGHEQNCIDGVIYALIDNTWDATFAFGFCNSLANEDNIRVCYKDALNYLGWSYNKDKDDKAVECENYAGDKVALCKELI